MINNVKTKCSKRPYGSVAKGEGKTEDEGTGDNPSNKTGKERNGMRTVVGNFRDYGFCFFQLLHPANVVELENPGTWVFYRPVFGKRCFLYLKYLNYKILLIAHKNIFSKRIWGVKNLTCCLKTFIGGLKKPYRAIITEQ